MSRNKLLRYEFNNSERSYAKYIGKDILKQSVQVKKNVAPPTHTHKVYIYIHIHIMCIYIYIYIHTEREEQHGTAVPKECAESVMWRPKGSPMPFPHTRATALQP